MGEVGLSRLIGLKSAVLFLAFVLTRNLSIPLIPLLLLHASLVSLLVAVASHPSINLPILLGKRPDGSFPLWSILLFGPYLAFIRIFMFLRRWKSGESAYSEIVPGFYVGGWPSSANQLPPGDPAVIDCTCELPRSKASSSNAYLCVATWDTRAPGALEIESAVRWASRKRAQNKPIYVHCAYGHGRSVCVMCALLVALGLAEDWKAAERMIRQRRPFIRMNSLHRRRLDDWSKRRVSIR